jgi:hypothetical protein
MPDSVAGLFRTRAEADESLRKLEEAGFPPGQVTVATPRGARRGRYGRKVLAGIAAGTVIGAIAGALATGIVPGMHPLLPGDVLATFALAAVAGTATGGVAGALVSMSASGDRTLYYEQEVQSGRILLSVRGPDLERARAILLEAGAMEAAPVEAPLEEGRPRPEAG